MTPAERLARAIELLASLPPVLTREDARAVQAARLELDLLLADLWRPCPVWRGAGYCGCSEEKDE
jgi:hypothetical protein